MSRSLVILSAIVLLLALLGMPSSSEADRSYTVRDGDTLARIARRHRTTVATLRAANRLRSENLRPGQSLNIPAEGVIYVGRGDTLGGLASRHDTTAAELARANRLRSSAVLRVGQRLVLPGSDVADAQEAGESRWGRTRRPGVADLVRMPGQTRTRVRLVDRNGRVRRRGLGQLSQIMRERGTRRASDSANRRLAAMIAQVSDHFGGRDIYVISGFRSAGGYTRESSRHTRGRAIDFRVRGVPNTTLRDYCRTFSDAGVGYYPRSRFVHLDARDSSAYWVDRSAPGQAPQYVRSRRGRADAEEAAGE